MTCGHPSEISDQSTASRLMVLSWGSLTDWRWWEVSWVSPAVGPGWGWGWGCAGAVPGPGLGCVGLGLGLGPLWAGLALGRAWAGAGLGLGWG